MNILVTGASGFIGSHLCIGLLDVGYKVVAMDNLSNSSKETMAKLHLINPKAKEDLIFHQVDLTSYAHLDKCFSAQPIDAVIHLAALKSVEESTKQPLKYYSNNIGGLTNLLNVMDKHDCTKMVFSSSATVYGLPQKLPLDENHPLSAVNPYGNTKIIGEYILCDLAASVTDSTSNSRKYSIISLRYFNPAGAHASGIIGEEFSDTPANLFPAMCYAHHNPDYQLKIFGNDYETKDGTCIRDIIHINDLVEGHVLALKKCLADDLGFSAVNLGCGSGWTVIEIIQTFEQALGSKLNYKIAPRRDGDVVASYASTSYAKEFLGWEAKHDLQSICRDAVNFLKNNYK